MTAQTKTHRIFGEFFQFVDKVSFKFRLRVLYKYSYIW